MHKNNQYTSMKALFFIIYKYAEKTTRSLLIENSSTEAAERPLKICRERGFGSSG